MIFLSRKSNPYLDDLRRDQLGWRILKWIAVLSFIAIGWIVFNADQAGAGSGPASQVVSRDGQSLLDQLPGR